MAKRRQHSVRRRKAREIRAAGNGQMIRMQAGGIEWIEAEAGEGKPKRFAMTAYTGGQVIVGFYSRPVVIDLDGLKAEAPVPILLNHEHGQVVGHADDVAVAQSSLKLKGLISGAGQAANEVIASSARGFPWKASVVVQPEKLEFVGEDVTVRVNGKSFKGPIYVARKGVLHEVSFVAVAADSRTSAKVAATAAKPTKEDSMDFEQWIEALGFTMETLTDAQKSALEAKYAAEVKAVAKKETGKQEGSSAPATSEPAAAVNAGGTAVAGAAVETHKKPAVEVPRFDYAAISLAHVKHETAIEAKAVEYTGKIEADKLAGIKAKAMKAAIELKAKALEQEWAAIRLEIEHIKAQAAYEVELIRAERPAAPAIHVPSRDGLSAELIEAACCLSGNYAEVEKEYKPEVLAAAEKRFGRSVGLQELILEASWANG